MAKDKTALYVGGGILLLGIIVLVAMPKKPALTPGGTTLNPTGSNPQYNQLLQYAQNQNNSNLLTLIKGLDFNGIANLWNTIFGGGSDSGAGTGTGSGGPAPAGGGGSDTSGGGAGGPDMGGSDSEFLNFV